jgi:hypothetical protein
MPPPVKKDLDAIFAQRIPPFLELMKTDPKAALAEFERSAGHWLFAHPTPSMQSLTAVEQQDVIRETIDRCLSKDGEPLRNYTDMWESFGDWLSSVAENTCASRYRSRAAKPKPPGEGERRAAVRAREPAGTPAAPARRRAAEAKPAPARRRPASEERPTRVLSSFLEWVRSPRVLIPVTIVVLIVAVRAFQTRRDPSSVAVTTSGPIDILLLNDNEARNPQYDVLELDAIPAGDNGNVPVTALFRSGRMTVLRVSTRGVPEGAQPTRIVVENGEGEVAWDSPLDAGMLGGNSLNLRIDPGTIVPDDYAVRVYDAAGAVVLRSAFTIVVQ